MLFSRKNRSEVDAFSSSRGIVKEAVPPSIFLRIPRAGSTSISSVGLPNCQVFGGKTENFWDGTLEKSCETPNGLSHRRLCDAVRSKVGCEAWSAALKFTSIRNPWDRAVSMWKHPACGGGTFKEFCQRLRKNEFSPAGVWHTEEMFYHLSDPSGNLVVDYLIRLEHAQEDFACLCDRLGVSRQTLPRKATSDRDSYASYYDSETRQIVAERYEMDIRVFQYAFGD